MIRWLNQGQLARSGKGSKPGAGYTISELLVVLAVTTVLLSVIMLYFRGRQAQAAFYQSVRNFEARLQAVSTEVSNGYFESGYECTVTGGGDPQVTLTQVTPGSNQACIFLGKVIVGKAEDINILTVLGRRTLNVSGKVVDAADLDQARPKAIVIGQKDLTVNYTQSYGLEILKIYELTSAGANSTKEYGAFGFFHELGAGAGTTAPLEGSRSIRLYGVDTTVAPVTLPPPAVANRVNDDNLDLLPNGLRICLIGGNGQRAAITVGGSGSQTTISSVLNLRPSEACGNV